MGSVGIGFQSDNFLNCRNPAGLSGVDTLRFILDVSAAVKISEFRTSYQKEHTTDFNFRSLAVGVRLSKRWTSSVGLSPYSNVGYRLSGQQTIQGTPDYVALNFSGSGGVNKFYWANAYEIFHGLSLGVTSSYIFGNITHNEDMEVFSIKNTYNINKIYFDFGVQYSHWFGQFTNVTVGGVYGYKSKMSIQRTQVITSSTTMERNERQPDIKTYVPESYGAGFSILRNKKAAEWIFAADYRYKNWSVDPSRHKGLTYTDSHTYSAGLQLTPNKKRVEKYIQAMRFQLGACYNQSYLKVNGYQVDDYSISAGAAFPFRNMSYINVAVNVGESKTGRRGGITERYVLLSVNLSLIERWFAKRQWD
ncbi:MAG: hypothetical protein LBK94_00130 [Prevotellaceae bacterium]|nr:hypothetical protein [Prevotellaceae bacterium]